MTLTAIFTTVIVLGVMIGAIGLYKLEKESQDQHQADDLYTDRMKDI